ncbi:MAG: hypothetical protein JWM27_1541 [Gemmatimonadetes bacterium]|nr:hypothetical protein [Gemmatimonadota bacterium]
MRDGACTEPQGGLAQGTGAGAGAEGEERGELLRLSASCPRCGSRPAMRITRPLVAALGAEPGTRRLATYQCQRRGCGAVYDLAAEAFRRAS